jgi:L-lactate dehydrogenase complex protein LldG
MGSGMSREEGPGIGDVAGRPLRERGSKAIDPQPLAPNPQQSARDEILGRLKSQVRDAESPEPWRSRRHFEDLAGQFAQALTAVNGEVRRAKDFAGALEQLDQILRQIEAESAVADAHVLLEDVDFPGRWPEVQWHIVGQTEGDLRGFAASADMGISGADAALAETGSVVVSSGPGRSRLTSLLPPVHVALVPTSCLTADIFTWTAARQEEPPSSLTLISGPSKTADIEQTMAIGVHGPKRFIAILYED